MGSDTTCRGQGCTRLENARYIGYQDQQSRCRGEKTFGSQAFLRSLLRMVHTKLYREHQKTSGKPACPALPQPRQGHGLKKHPTLSFFLVNLTCVRWRIIRRFTGKFRESAITGMPLNVSVVIRHYFVNSWNTVSQIGALYRGSNVLPSSLASVRSLVSLGKKEEEREKKRENQSRKKKGGRGWEGGSAQQIQVSQVTSKFPDRHLVSIFRITPVGKSKDFPPLAL